MILEGPEDGEICFWTNLQTGTVTVSMPKATEISYTLEEAKRVCKLFTEAIELGEKIQAAWKRGPHAAEEKSNSPSPIQEGEVWQE